LWACLGSNQRPLPYQGERKVSALYRRVRGKGINKANCERCVDVSVRRVPPRAVRVGVTVGVEPRGITFRRAPRAQYGL
jgi:hypothetical protein